MSSSIILLYYSIRKYGKRWHRMTQHCALATDSTQEKTKDVARISTLHAPTSPPAEDWIILHVITFRHSSSAWHCDHHHRRQWKKWHYTLSLHTLTSIQHTRVQGSGWQAAAPAPWRTGPPRRRAAAAAAAAAPIRGKNRSPTNGGCGRISQGKPNRG